MSVVQDTESHPASHTLDMIGALVFDPERRYAWLEHEHSADRQMLFDRMLLMLGALAANADWDMHTLLTELGFRKRTPAQLQALSEGDLNRCTTFFEWIADLGREAPASTTIMRGLISAAATIFSSSGGDLNACKRSMQQTLAADDPYTPADLVRIGEIGAAFAAARLALPRGRARREARAAAASNPFREGHISAATLDLWFDRVEHDADLLAIEQRARLDDHIPSCDRCLRAAEHRAAALGVLERPVPALAEPLALLKDR